MVGWLALPPIGVGGLIRSRAGWGGASAGGKDHRRLQMAPPPNQSGSLTSMDVIETNCSSHYGILVIGIYIYQGDH